MNFIFSKKTKEKTLIFDIGSGSVGGAIVYLPQNEDETPVILKSCRYEIKKHIDNKKFHEKEIFECLRKASEYLFKTNPGKISNVFCTLTSPWTETFSKKINYISKKEVSFTKELADNIFQNETTSINNSINSSETIVIEKLITEIRLNNESIEDPVGKKFNFVDMDINYSVSSKSFIEKSKDIIRQFFNVDQIILRPFSLVSFLMIRNNYPKYETYLILDIGGEFTEVSSVKKSYLENKKSFPFGKNSIIKNIALSLKIENRDAEELFRLYYQNNMASSLKEKIQIEMEQVESFWVQEFKKVLFEIDNIKTIPKTIFLTIDNEMRNWFFGVFKNKKFEKDLTLNNTFKVIILDENELINKCFYTEGSHDPFIMIGVISLSDLCQK